MVECIVGAVIYALGVFTGSYLYHRSKGDLSPFPVVRIPSSLHKVRPAKRDEDE